MIRWIFFDVGNVLMNDDPVMAFLYEELYRSVLESGRRIRFRQLLEDREGAIRKAGPGHWAVLGRRYLGEDGLKALIARCTATLRRGYMDYHSVIPGMPEAVRSLAGRYGLGLIANQLREVLPALDAAGLGRWFRVKAVSEIVGLEKPDPAMFRWALRAAGCRPEEAIMVGDRVDNDIAPARGIGMWTVWVHIPHHERETEARNRRADLYQASQMRVSVSSLGPRTERETPDADATSAEGLVRAVADLAARSRGTEKNGTWTETKDGARRGR